MSADLLRRAAAELRDAATHVPPSPWEVHESPGGSALAVVSKAPSERVSGRSGAILKRASTQVAMSPLRRGHRQNIAYIAKLHPDVALALATLLDEIASQYDGPKCDAPHGCCNNCESRFDFVVALDLARDILGADA